MLNNSIFPIIIGKEGQICFRIAKKNCEYVKPTWSNNPSAGTHPEQDQTSQKELEDHLACNS